MAQLSQRARTFASIYKRNAWNGEPGIGAGPGSTPEATLRVKTMLPHWCRLFNVKTLVDAGCGDALWVPNLPCTYIGVDIVPEVIARRSAADPTRTYVQMDFVDDYLPECDAVMCRDAFQHLSFEDIFAAMDNFRSAGARMLFANSHRGGENVRIRSGRWFAVDLEAEPFNMGQPSLEIMDGQWATGVRWPGKFFGAWAL